MHYLMGAIEIELLKVRKSKMLWVTLAAFTLAPLMGGFFMFVLKNPDFAASSGLLGAKAQIFGEANWPAYFSLLAQIIAIGGILVFGFVTSWIFGREYTDRTIKDLLALPYHKGVIVLAKFIAMTVTAVLLSLYVIVLGMLLGAAIGLPGWSMAAAAEGFNMLLITVGLTVALSTPAAFFACYGKGYLAPLGFVVVMIVLSQIIAAIGYGHYFPWAIPALFSGITDGLYVLTWSNFSIVFLTGFIGFIGTFVWWLKADQQ